MQRVREWIKKTKENKYFNIIIKIFVALLLTYLFMQMVLNLGYVSESKWQTHKDHYFGCSVAYFLLAVCILAKVKMINPVIWIFSLIYGVIAYLIMTKSGYEIDLYNVYKMRWVCGGLCGILGIDMIMSKKVAAFKERNLKGTICYGIMALLALLVTGGGFYTYTFLFPFALFYLIRVGEKDWNRFLLCFSFGYYGAFVYTMLKSFMQVPYTGERYYGIYVNHGLFGIFIGGAFVCALWWLICLFQNKASLWKKGIAGAAIIFPFVCSMMNSARVAQLAIIVTAFFAIFLFAGKSDKKSVLYRFISVGLVAVLLLVGFVGVLAVLRNFDRETMETIITNDILREQILYWCNRAQTLFAAETKTGIFESGSFINALDRFSSARLSYWYVYLSDLNLFGHESVYVTYGDLVCPHPHNTFVYWLYAHGLLSALLCIVWVVYYIFVTAIEALKKKTYMILPVLWVIYYSTVSLNEDILWIYMTGFILLMLQYPVLVKLRDNDKKTEKTNV